MSALSDQFYFMLLLIQLDTMPRHPRPCLFAPQLAEGILDREDIPVSDGSSIIEVKHDAPKKALVRNFVLESVYSKITLRAKTDCLLSSSGNSATKKRHEKV